MTIATDTPTRVGAPELCPRCDQTVAKAKTRAGKTILMDFHPSQIGTFVITSATGPDMVVAKAARYMAPDDERPRFTCHWDHCRGRMRNRASYTRQSVGVSPFGN